MNPYDITQPLLKALLVYRLNYWVLHYVFIFILGGYDDTYRRFQNLHAEPSECTLHFLLGLSGCTAGLLL